MRSQALRTAALRVGVLRLLILACFFVLAGRAAWLTVVMVDAAREKGDAQAHTRMGVTPARGLILDRDGHELAITVRSPSIYVVPEQLAAPEADIRRLADALDRDANELRRRLIGRRGFRYVARWTTPEVAERVAGLGLAGVGVELEPRRSYPSGPLAANLVGFADIDGVGVRGVEQMEDAWLKGSAHTVALQRDARGQLLSDHEFDPRRTVGGDVRLSIDAGLQAMAEEALAEVVNETGAEGGFVVVMDPKTGDLLSLAERPTFDPNDFRSVDFQATGSPAFEAALEPGSTFKALLVAAALDAGAIRHDQRFDTGNGKLRVPGKTIRDHDPYGVLDPEGILTRSSNIGAVMIGDALGAQRYYHALRAFGFGERTGSGFPAESTGILRSWKLWRPIDAATHSYGQGVAVTAVQLASAMATLANDGRRMQPRLVVARREPLGEWDEIAPVSRGQIVSPETARDTLALMTGVVGPHGTGRLAGLEGLSVAGKTGTAQKLDAETRRYSQRDYIAWFMAAVPAEDPVLAIVVGVDEPEGAVHSGGLVAAPIFARVATDHLADLGVKTRPAPIPAEEDPVVLAAAERFRDELERTARAEEAAHQRRTRARRAPADPPAEAVRVAASTAAQPPVSAPPPARPVTAVASSAGARPAVAVTASAPRDRAVLVPDFVGERADRATALAAREDLDVRVLGNATGECVAQDPRPGTIISGPTRTILLTFAAARGGPPR